MKSPLAALALAMLLPGRLLAAPQEPGGPLPRGGPPEAPPRDEAFRMVDAYIVSNIQESLGLTDEQFVKLLPLVKRLQNDRRAFIHRRQRGLHGLRLALQSGTATEARVGELLKDLQKMEAEEPAAIRKDVEAIDANLSVVQQAKFRVLEVEVEMKIRQLLNQIRKEARPTERNQRDNPPLPGDRPRF